MPDRALERARRLVLPAMLASSAHRVPRKTALLYGEHRLCYSALSARAVRFAAALAGRGVRPGCRVALMLHNGIEIVEAFFGCQLAGAIPVPVNFRLTSDEVGFILSDARAVGIVHGTELTQVAVLAAAAAPMVRWRIEVGAESQAPDSYERFLAAAQPAPPDVLLSEDDIAFLIYTSGTTGRPKGAMITHRNLYASTVSWVHEVGARHEDVWLSGQPLFHIGGINGLLPFIYLGATIVLNPTGNFDPRLTIALMKEHRVTR